VARRRLTLEEAKLSGAYEHNKARFADRLAAPELQSMQPVRFRAPKHFNTAERAAHREIMATCSGVTEADRLLVEVAAVLLAKQRAGTAKPSELNKLAGLLERLRSRVVAMPAAPGPSVSTLSGEEKELEDYFREEDEYQALETRIRAEMERRRNTPPPEHLTPAEAARWCWYSTVANDLDPDRKVNQTRLRDYESR